jgi:hypothetical protein
MPYFVEIVPAVTEYLDSVAGLSEACLEELVDGVTEELCRDADRFLAINATGPESLHFRYDYPHPDGSTLFEFDFIVDGTEMPSGVVRVVYVEHTVYPIP